MQFPFLSLWPSLTPESTSLTWCTEVDVRTLSRTRLPRESHEVAVLNRPRHILGELTVLEHFVNAGVPWRARCSGFHLRASPIT